MSKYTVLIADDEVSNLEILNDILNKMGEGFEIWTAPNGKVVMRILKDQRPDLIILDWQMPEMDGMETLRRINSNENLADIPVIVATGVMIGSENLSTALESEAVDFLRKPFDAVEFNARVRNVLRQYENRNKLKRQRAEIEERNRELQAFHEKEKMWYEKELQTKNNELKRLGVLMSKRHSLLEKLREELDDLLSVSFNNKNIQEQFHKTIERELDTEADWAQFRAQLESIYPGFFEHIQQRFGPLTSNEEKICAYLKVNLSSKEIASLTHVTTGAVEKARYRLRKKMELPRDVSLESVLSSM